MAKCDGVWESEIDPDGETWWDTEDEHVCCLEQGHEEDGIYHICAQHFACWHSPWARSGAASAAD